MAIERVPDGGTASQDPARIAGMHLAGSMAAAGTQAAKAQKDEEAKKARGAKGSFLGAIERAQEEITLQKEGFPKEIAGLDTEDAAVYLKDRADMAADVLKEHQTPKEFEEYRRCVSQFLRYIVKNNFAVHRRDRRGYTRRGRELEPQYKITIINQKLDEMAKWILSSHKDALSLLARVDEIKGLIIDIMAS